MKKITAFVCILFAALLCVTAFAATTRKIVRYPRGDINLDGTVNTGDATLILKYCADQYEITDELSLILANANANDEINTADASYVLRIVAGVAEQLYYEVEVPDDDPVPTPTPSENPDGKCTITFDAGEGTLAAGYPESLSFEKNTNIIIFLTGPSAVKAEREGFAFVGWQIDDKLIDNSYSEYYITSNITAHAVYGENMGADVVVTYYDSFNELDINKIETVSLDFAATALTKDDLKDIPSGYHLADKNVNISVSIENGIANPAQVTVNVYPYYDMSEGEFKAIRTQAGLLKVQDDLAGKYIMDNDVDMLSYGNFMPFGWPWETGSGTITFFTGIFDGNGCKITNLYIDYILGVETMENGYINVGLFAVNDGTIRNLWVYTKPCAGGDDQEYGVFGDVNVGTIAGYNKNTMINCHAFGNVGSFDYVNNTRGAAGGVAGTNGTGAKMSRCSFEGGVEGFYYIGGIVGKDFGTMDQCYFAGGINYLCDEEFLTNFGVSYVGGICGAMQDGYITNCYAYLTHDVLADYCVGSVMGWVNRGTIKYVFTVNGENYVGYVSGYGGVWFGAFQEEPTWQSIYSMTEEPEMMDLDTSVWDLNGASYSGVPDLIKNRRGKSFYDNNCFL